MAVDMFLNINNKAIKGESQDNVHAGEIDVLAWSWGMSNSGTTHVGSGGGAGKVNVQDLSVTKYVDSSSPALILACCNGTHYAQALLTIRKAGGSPVEYIKITLTEVLITSISGGGSGGEDRLTENITLNFAKFNYTYTPQDSTGKAQTAIPATWNVATNAPS